MHARAGSLRGKTGLRVHGGIVRVNLLKIFWTKCYLYLAGNTRSWYQMKDKTIHNIVFTETISIQSRNDGEK